MYSYSVMLTYRKLIELDPTQLTRFYVGFKLVT